MSNFQRSRSKVWWGDSPPNIGSPVALPAERNQNNQANAGALGGSRGLEDNWAPQLPHWIANAQVPPVVDANYQENVMSPEAVPNQWPLRHGSPGSHKSQDSGFSDSDSSPAASQYYPSPNGEGKSPSNKSSSSSDSNNHENVTVKQAIDFKESPKSAKSLDTLDAPSTSKLMTVPNGRLRSTSVIQTPYDLQKYMEVHDDEEHLKLLTDSTDDATDNKPVKDSPTNDIKITVTPPQIVHNHSYAGDKNVDNKSFVSKKKESTSKSIKVAKVKDLETNKTKSQDSLQFLQVSDIDHIAVNNQPRIRSPISTIPYEPAPDYNEINPDKKRPTYSRSHSQQNRREIEESKFERNRLNKSLNYEGQRLDQQILDIQEGYHSLGYIHEDISHLKENVTPEVTPTSRGFTASNITDSLHLKNHKKVGPKSKQRHASKAKAGTCSFRIFPTKRKKPEVVETHAGGILEGSRVPSLGLPRYSEQDQWVMVGHPELEMLVHNERLIGSESDINLHSKLYKTKESQTKATEVKRLTPPLQFQDHNTVNSRSNKKSSGDLTHDSKREKLKGSTENFNGQLSMACTSTPKMLAPNEYMDQMFLTPQIPNKSTRLRRINLLDNFNGSTNTPQDPSQFRERSIDQTPLERVCERTPECVQYWLCDLVGSCEAECMTTLQSKALGGEHRALLSASSATITGNIKKVQTHGQIIVHQYGDILKQLESGEPSEEQLCLLVANVNEFVLAHSITLNTRPPGETPERWDRIRKSLQGYLQRLVEIGEDIKTELNDSDADWEVVGRHLESLVRIFEETTKAVLVQQLRTLVSIIEEPPSDLILKSTLTSIAHLSAPSGDADAPHPSCARLLRGMRELPFVECAVPRALLAAAIETDKSSVKALALRALATICVTGEAVQQFEQGGGIDIISDMLSDEAAPEPAAREAVTVLAQVTAPWLRADAAPARDLRQLRAHLDPLVASITRIVTRTECCQLLLLCAACLSHLVRELAGGGAAEGAGAGEDGGEMADALARHRTVERLLDAVKARGPDISVFLQEQTAALLSELSRARGCVRVLCGARAASVALVCFARSVPAHARDDAGAPEERARARLLRHTAAAIGRLCVLPEVASQIVQLEGVPRLIRLVRLQRARQLRPDADETLLHCLQALRAIHRHHPEAFRGQQADVGEMIRPHLAESLVKFSSKKESFV